MKIFIHKFDKFTENMIDKEYVCSVMNDHKIVTLEVGIGHFVDEEDNKNFYMIYVGTDIMIDATNIKHDIRKIYRDIIKSTLRDKDNDYNVNQTIEYVKQNYGDRGIEIITI
jgi:hypothetical protein